MKTEKDKEIDDLFKQGLEPSDTHSGYMEEDWSAMEQRLDERKKRPVIIYWLPILGSVAALLLLVIGWWLLKPIVTHHSKTQQMAVTKTHVKQGHTDDDKQQRMATNTSSIDTVTPNGVRQGKLMAVAGNSTIAANTSNTRHSHPNSLVVKNNVVALQPVSAVQIQQQPEQLGLSKNYANLAAYSPAIAINASVANEQTIKAGNYLAANNSAVSQSAGAIKKKAINSYRPQFALTVLASSNKNSVSSLEQAKPGNDAGLLLSVGISKRFTISTGALYSSKQYMSNFADYHTTYQFQTNPVSIVANCKMFDIPLNIDYKVFNTYRNKISIGTGISSYLMLHESYQYNYPEYSSGGPARYNVPNPDKYLLSIVNLQATYERQINSSVGITLQPYMKLPLSAVGASQVRLQSTGVAVGLTWNLNSSSKP